MILPQDYHECAVLRYKLQRFKIDRRKIQNNTKSIYKIETYSNEISWFQKIEKKKIIM